MWYEPFFFLPELQQAVGVRNVLSSIRRIPCKCSDEMQNIVIFLTLCCSFARSSLLQSLNRPRIIG